jgi:uncharacterized protein (DUF305 family)
VAEAAAPRRFSTVWLALAVVVGLLLGYAGGLLTPIVRAPDDTSAEAGFARDMSVHHAQAVELAMIAYQKATNEDVRSLAYKIVTTQQAQIGVMKRWLEEWRLEPTGSQPRMAWMPGGGEPLANGLMPGMATNQEVDRLRQSSGKDVDRQFVELMIRHHLGGIHMVEGLLKVSHRPEVVTLATVMKNGQQNEITVMRDLQRDASN